VDMQRRFFQIIGLLRLACPVTMLIIGCAAEPPRLGFVLIGEYQPTQVPNNTQILDWLFIAYVCMTLVAILATFWLKSANQRRMRLLLIFGLPVVFVIYLGASVAATWMPL
jgi:hypothetical protein